MMNNGLLCCKKMIEKKTRKTQNLQKILYKPIDYWYNTVVCVRYSAYGLNLKEVFTGLLLGYGANIKMR